MARVENESAESAVSQWVTFSLAEETYGIDVMRVQEVLPINDIAPVPGAPSYVLGIINLRGNVVTVIDTRMQLGLEPRDADSTTRVVVIETRKQVMGMMVDSVAEVVNIEQSEIDTAPNVGNEESSRYIQGVVTRDSELLILLDADRLLSGSELEELAAM
jgi:purine-binding chemotaxis protein CheW